VGNRDRLEYDTCLAEGRGLRRQPRGPLTSFTWHFPAPSAFRGGRGRVVYRPFHVEVTGGSRPGY
jgi:hypothetical protein